MTSPPATVATVRVPDERVRAFFGSSLAGALAFLALHLQFVALWPALYSLHPWKGYETAMRQGWVSPGHLESPLAFRVAMVFLVILPITMLRHMFTSPLNMYLRDRERPKGAMKPLPNLMETELESFGASTVSEMTWKQLLDTDACTMCGRCTSVCPAHATGKPLDPREIVLKTGEVMAATGSPQVSPPIGVDAEQVIRRT